MPQMCPLLWLYLMLMMLVVFLFIRYVKMFFSLTYEEKIFKSLCKYWI